MSIFKAVLQVLNKNKFSLLLGVGIMTLIVFFLSGQLQDQQNMRTRVKVAVIDAADTPVSQGLRDYLAQEQTVVTLDDLSEKGLDDALYFGKVDYILWLPADLETRLTKGEKPTLTTQTRPDAFAKELVNSTVNNFLNTYRFYAQADATASQGELLQLTTKQVQQKGTVELDHSYRLKVQQILISVVFNMIAYGLFMTIFSAYGTVNLAFNSDEISQRTRLSPISSRQLNRQISLSTLSVVVGLIVFFTGFIVVYTRSPLNMFTGYLLINVAVFATSMISFSALVTSAIKNPEAISGISNVFILGSCFIGGVFVSATVLPAAVSKIAAFTPTYWFVQNNRLVGETLQFDAAFQTRFWFQCGILLAFTAVFVLGQFLMQRERRGNLTWFAKA